MTAAETEFESKISEKEYFEQRLDDQIDWYERKSAANQKAYKRLRLIEIIVATSIPLLAGYGHYSPYIGLTVGIFGLVVAMIAGILALYRFQENWSEYRAAAESLRQEKYLYLARAAPYDGERCFELLVERVEALLSRETTNWARAMRSVDTADKSGRGGAKGPDALS